MKLYLVHGVVLKDNGGYTVHRWVGTQADCAKARNEFVEQGAVKKDLKTQEIDVPTDKQGLLEFLNKGQHV